jgi:hypothetical protein
METGLSSGEIEVFPLSSKPSLAGTILRIIGASGLQSDIVEEVPARVNHSNAQPKMTEYVGSLGFA